MASSETKLHKSSQQRKGKVSGGPDWYLQYVWTFDVSTTKITLTLLYFLAIFWPNILISLNFILLVSYISYNQRTNRDSDRCFLLLSVLKIELFSTLFFMSLPFHGLVQSGKVLYLRFFLFLYTIMQKLQNIIQFFCCKVSRRAEMVGKIWELYNRTSPHWFAFYKYSFNDFHEMFLLKYLHHSRLTTKRQILHPLTYN